jgi:hypothetical protein
MTCRSLAFVLVLLAAFTGAVLRTSAETEALDVAKVKRQISRAWEGNDRKAIRVADCESSLNPKATSPGGTYLGLWQFSRATWRDYGGPGDDPRDVSAYRQTLIAWKLFQDRRWAPWPNCA